MSGIGMDAGFPVKQMNGDLEEEIRFYLQNILFILDMFNLLESDQIMEGQLKGWMDSFCF